MKRILIVLVLAVGWLGASPVSSPRDVMDTEVVIVNAKAPPANPFQYEYELMLYPTVRISSPSGTGSGVVISATQIYILTAAHVVEDESIVTIEVFYPEHIELESDVVITDTTKDLALLKIRSIPLSLHVYSASLTPKCYQPYLFNPVYTIGCSLGLPPRPSDGILSVIGQDNWEVTSPVLPGNSGGPVYDGRTYEMIGIAIWVKVYDQQLVTTMAGIVPINQIYKFLDSHRGTETTEKSK